MNVDCSLVHSSGVEHRIVTLVVWSRLCRFPRMFARVEGTVPLGAGPFTFKLECATNDTAAFKTLAQSRWHLQRLVSQSSTQRTFLELVAEPGAHLQVHPFAMNDCNVEDIVKPLLHSTDVTLKGTADVPKIEALVSCGETLEQLCARLGMLTGALYRVCAVGTEGWNMEWAHMLQAMSTGETVCQAHALARIESTLEQGFQRVGIPTDAATELLLTGTNAYSTTAWQPVQLGWTGPEAVTFGPPLSEAGEPLTSLLSDWGYLTDIEQVPALWAGARITLSEEVIDANVLATIFVYSNEDLINVNASYAIEKVLGGRPERQEAQQWLCATLSVRTPSTPLSKTLIHRIIEASGGHQCLEKVLYSIGLPSTMADCGATVAQHFDNLPAVVIKNPLAPELGPVGRTKDCLRYRSKIWIQILGVRGPIEVDWAIPFASHDNSATGGSKGGDFILVPSEFTLGYVSWIEAGYTGAPLFFATTHYHDVSVSEGIGTEDHTHGLVTHNGLKIHERSSHIHLQACDTMTITAHNVFQRSGNDH